MFPLLLAVALGCPTVGWTFQNHTIRGPNDQANLDLARNGCIDHYGPGACLVHMTKLGANDYHATCRRGAAE